MLQIAQPAPPRWNIGMQTSDRPPSRISGIFKREAKPGVEHVGQPVSIAPLGRPVVPDVQNCQADRAVDIAMRVDAAARQLVEGHGAHAGGQRRCS